MGIAQKVVRHFSDAVRSRGQSYFVKGRVTVMAARPGEVVAKVRGTSKYRVRLRMRGSKLLASCTCPYFSPQGEPCKHLWATLLLAEARGMLQSPPVYPVHLVTESPRRSSTVGLPETRNDSGVERDPSRPGQSDLGMGATRSETCHDLLAHLRGDPGPRVKIEVSVVTNQVRPEVGVNGVIRPRLPCAVAQVAQRARFQDRDMGQDQVPQEPRLSIGIPNDCLCTFLM